MDESIRLAIKAQLERKTRVKSLVQSYAFLADPKEAVHVANSNSKPESCVTSEKQPSGGSNAVNVSQQFHELSLFLRASLLSWMRILSWTWSLWRMLL
eukprot:g34270.t1